MFEMGGLQMRLVKIMAVVLVLAAAGVVRAAPQPRPGLQVIGDGLAPSRVQLILTNPGATALTVQLASHTVLRSAGRQDMMILEGRTIQLAAKGSARTTLPAMCVGGRAETPATAEPTAYTMVLPADVPTTAAAIALSEAAKRIKARGDLTTLPLAPGTVAQTLAQLAFWQERGDLSKEALRETVVSQLKLEGKPLESAEKKEVDEGTDRTWDAIDLVQKEAKKP
jgi:hypothetical protein